VNLFIWFCPAAPVSIIVGNIKIKRLFFLDRSLLAVNKLPKIGILEINGAGPSFSASLTVRQIPPIAKACPFFTSAFVLTILESLLPSLGSSLVSPAMYAWFSLLS